MHYDSLYELKLLFINALVFNHQGEQLHCAEISVNVK